MIRKILLLLVLLVTISLIGASCGDDNPVEPKNFPPSIKTFIFSPTDILILDSTMLVWNVERADSLRITELDTTISPVDSGKIVIFPDSSMVFTAVAYNNYGRDTVVSGLQLTVVPFRVQPKATSYFRAEYGSSVPTPPLVFIVSDSTGRRLADTTVSFSLVAGDGTLSTLSGVTDANGEVVAAYEFTGSETESQIRAGFAGVDSSDVWLRVNTLRFLKPSASFGQAQCVFFDDTYRDVVNFNGQPDAIAHTPGDQALVAEYDGSFGVVFVVWDENDDGIPDDTSSVLGAAVVDSIFPTSGGGTSVRYEGTDQFGIGIGSDFNADIKSRYGNASAIRVDTSLGSTPEISVIIKYDTLKTVFWCYEDTSSVFEIDLYDFVPSLPSPAKSKADLVARALNNYRLGKYMESKTE